MNQQTNNARKHIQRSSLCHRWHGLQPNPHHKNPLFQIHCRYYPYRSWHLNPIDYSQQNYSWNLQRQTQIKNCLFSTKEHFDVDLTQNNLATIVPFVIHWYSAAFWNLPNLFVPELIWNKFEGDSCSASPFGTSFLSMSEKQTLTQYFSWNSRLIYLMQHTINNGSMIPTKPFSLIFTLLNSKRAARPVLAAALKEGAVGWYKWQ